MYYQTEIKWNEIQDKRPESYFIVIALIFAIEDLEIEMFLWINTNNE